MAKRKDNSGALRRSVRSTISLFKRDPDRYSFHMVEVPKTLEDKACVIGWIGYYANLHGVISTVEKEFGIRDDLIYGAMDSITKNAERSWHNSAQVAAEGLKALLETGFFGFTPKSKKKKAV